MELNFGHKNANVYVQPLCFLCACMCLNLYAFAAALCSGSPRDARCADEWYALCAVSTVRGVKVHYGSVEY